MRQLLNQRWNITAKQLSNATLYFSPEKDGRWEKISFNAKGELFGIMTEELEIKCAKLIKLMDTYKYVKEIENEEGYDINVADLELEEAAKLGIWAIIVN